MLKLERRSIDKSGASGYGRRTYIDNGSEFEQLSLLCTKSAVTTVDFIDPFDHGLYELYKPKCDHVSLQGHITQNVWRNSWKLSIRVTSEKAPTDPTCSLTSSLDIFQDLWLDLFQLCIQLIPNSFLCLRAFRAPHEC